ncbi:MAG: radical SAM protein [Bacillota bacterium]
MTLTGLHFLLTYQCTRACPHCFVFGSPGARGTFRLDQIRSLLDEGERLGSIRSIYFEGGEPFLHDGVLREAVREASRRGWHVGVVTNGYWATSPKAARARLEPLARNGLTELTLSADALHGGGPEPAIARSVADALGIRAGTISLKGDCGDIMYRGRAALEMAGQVDGHPWTDFTACPHEPLEGPDRVHIDADGWVHICQGLVMGNCWQTPLTELVQRYDPAHHPIVSPLLAGGPAELTRVFGLPDGERYADACHLCFLTRARLRGQYPDLLAPAQVYEEPSRV